MFLAVASVVILFQAVCKIKARNEAERDALRERAGTYDEAMKPLLNEKRRLERELAALEDEQKREQSFAASVLFLCTEPDARVMTDIVPALDDYSYTGLLAVSDTQFFGDEGCLTVAQVNKLLRKGWGLCVSADATTDVEALCSRIAQASLPAPTAVYYPEADFTKAQENTLLALGIDTLICYGEKAESRLWSVTAYGSYETDAKNVFFGMTGAGDSIVLTVGYTRSREKYASSNFDAMLRTVESGVGDGTAFVRTLAAAHDCYMEYKNSDSGSFDNRRSELEKRLQEIDAQIGEQAK